MAEHTPDHERFPRDLGDHGVQGLVGETPDDVAAEDETSGGRITTEPPRGETRAEARARLGHGLIQAEQFTFNMVVRAADEMKTVRRALQVDKRYDIEFEKFRVNLAASFDEGGEVKASAPSGHLREGLTLGLFIDAVTTIGPALVAEIFGGSQRPFTLQPRAERAENEKKQEIVEKLLDDQLNRSNWREEMETAIFDLAKHGTTTLRQSWTDELEMQQIRRGEFEEVVRRRGVTVKSWHPMRVYVSDPERPHARDQDTVIWSSEVTLDELARNEMVFDTDRTIEMPNLEGVAQRIPFPVKIGIYDNLESLRRAEAKTLRQDFTRQYPSTSQIDKPSDEQGDFKVTPFDTLERFELQGKVSMGALLRAEVWTLEQLAFWGVVLMNKDGDPVEGEEAARLADRMTWYITVVRAGGTGGGGSVIELRLCPYRRPRTELLSGRFITDGRRFYGLSADAIANDVEAAADKALNDMAAIVSNNGNPPMAIKASAFKDEENIEDADVGDGFRFTVDANFSASDVFQYFFKPLPPELLLFIQMLKETYATRTMASQAQKGGAATTGTDTLGEVVEQREQGEKRVRSIARRIAELELIIPSIKLIIEDMHWFFGDEGLQEQAKMVAGLPGLESATIFPVAEGPRPEVRQTLDEEFEIAHPGISSIQRDVATQFLMAIAQNHRDLPNLDRPKLLIEAGRMIGADLEPMFKDLKPLLSPGQEHEMIQAGDRPEVDERENLEMHLSAHEERIFMLSLMSQSAQRASPPQDTEWLDKQIEVLEKHAQDTRERLEVQQEALQQAAELQASLTGQGAQNGQGQNGSQAPGGVPPGQNQISQGLAASVAAPTGGPRANP